MGPLMHCSEVTEHPFANCHKLKSSGKCSSSPTRLRRWCPRTCKFCIGECYITRILLLLYKQGSTRLGIAKEFCPFRNVSHIVFFSTNNGPWDENTGPLFRGARCTEVSLSGASTVNQLLYWFLSFQPKELEQHLQFALKRNLDVAQTE